MPRFSTTVVRATAPPACVRTTLPIARRRWWWMALGVDPDGHHIEAVIDRTP
ncbi:hypothetical protein ACFOPN_03005 [Xanthomonas hyacinthi]|uniref:hypothetical protein n=1 Tax=Xanthomonas hyacinthi TaxID=56455 RepID=UPI003607EC4E